MKGEAQRLERQHHATLDRPSGLRSPPACSWLNGKTPNEPSATSCTSLHCCQLYVCMHMYALQRHLAAHAGRQTGKASYCMPQAALTEIELHAAVLKGSPPCRVLTELGAWRGHDRAHALLTACLRWLPACHLNAAITGCWIMGPAGFAALLILHLGSNCLL